MTRIGLILAAILLILLGAGVLLMQSGSRAPEQAPSVVAEAPTAPAEAVEEPADLTSIEPAAGPPGAEPPPDTASDPPDPSVAPPKKKNGHGGSKVLSYFQHGKTTLDTARAFGFVLLPRTAVTDAEKRAHKSFCELMLASLDFMTPGAVAASAPADVLATYWPITPSRGSFEIKEAFALRNCDDLLAWYDHALARKLAAKAGVAELSGPLLITWPSGGAADAVRDPLIVDFSKADHARATKALQYWFRQLKNRPELWTNRIREGTIRTELADAVNDTAGVVLAVMSGKWDSLNTVATP